MSCDCEAKGLEVAVRQAETRMMQSMYNDIRSWVRAHAQDYILEYFRLLAERRKQAHSVHLDRITAHAYHYYNAPPHPNEIAAAQAQLKRGIDEDWQASVQRYPEVLEYFFSLVDLTLPDDDVPAVRDPPLSALSGMRKAGRRSAAGTVTSGVSVRRGRDPSRARRTPPPLDMRDRRARPLSRDGRPFPPEGRPFAAPPPPPNSNFYGGPPPPPFG